MYKITGVSQFTQSNNNFAGSYGRNSSDNSPIAKKQSGDSISFGKKRAYTSKHFRMIKQLKEAALKFKLPDAFTGLPFSPENPPTIEHLIPFSQLKKLGLKDGHWNWVLASQEVNLKKDNMTLPEFFEKHPDYEKNFLKNIKEYEKAKIHGFGAALWVKKIQNTFDCVLKGITPKVARK